MITTRTQQWQAKSTIYECKYADFEISDLRVLGHRVVRGRKNPLHYGLARRLKRTRRASKLTRQRLAVLAGISHSTVAEIEDGQQVPGISVVVRIAAALNVSASSLAFSGSSAAPAVPCASVELIGSRLTRLRTARGFSRKALARAVGLSDTAIRHSEEGRHLPGLETIEQLARVLGAAPGWLAFGEGEPPEVPTTTTELSSQ